MSTRTIYNVNGPKVVHELFDDEAVIVDLDSGNYYSLEGLGAQICKSSHAGGRRNGRDSLVDPDPLRRLPVRNRGGAVVRLFAELESEGLAAAVGDNGSRLAKNRRKSLVGRSACHEDALRRTHALPFHRHAGPAAAGPHPRGGWSLAGQICPPNRVGNRSPRLNIKTNTGPLPNSSTLPRTLNPDSPEFMRASKDVSRQRPTSAAERPSLTIASPGNWCAFVLPGAAGGRHLSGL